jgi:hypothetical protein
MPKLIVASAGAAVGALAAALFLGCPSLSALECQGSGCGSPSEGGAGAGSALDIGCGPAGSCGAPSEECCLTFQKAPACVAALQCTGGTDIFCDDSAQCGGAPCWLCNAGGLQGASCNYQEDIVQTYHCTNPKDVYRLCRSSSECDAGSSCVPIPITLPGPPSADGGSAGPTFSACLP